MAGVVGFGMVGSGDSDGGSGGVGWTFAPEEAGACSGGEGVGGVPERASGMATSFDTAGVGGLGGGKPCAWARLGAGLGVRGGC